MAVVADNAKLVLKTFAAMFQNNLASADAVEWKKYDQELEDRNRLTVVEQVGPRFTITQNVNGVADLTAGTQDVILGSEQFQVNRVFGASMSWGDFEKIRDLGEARESMAIKNAALNMAEQIDAYILRVAMLASNNWTGTPGNAIASFQNVAAGYTRLKEEGVDDADIRAILTYADKEALGANVTTNNASLTDIGSGIYRAGFTGDVAGLPTMFTQQVPTHTSGTRAQSGANVNVAGANQNVNYSAVSISGAPGQYLTQTLNIRVSAAGTETVLDGEVFTIAGVNAYDNRLQASLGRPQQFRVIGDYTAAAGLINNMRIFPAIIVPGTGTGVAQIAANRANATVTAVPADGALITFATAPGAQVRPRALIQKQSILVNTCDLVMPATGMGSRQALTKMPASIRMWRDSTFATGEHRVRFDIALTANVRDRRRIVRING
jgi:hypothetical protein